MVTVAVVVAVAVGVVVTVVGVAVAEVLIKTILLFNSVGSMIGIVIDVESNHSTFASTNVEQVADVDSWPSTLHKL